MARSKRRVMVGTDFTTQGGIASVARLYRDSGFLEEAGFVYVVSHGDGSAGYKLWRALAGLGSLAVCLCRYRVSLMHVHLSSRASFWRKRCFVGLARLCRVPYVLHLHGSEFQTFYEQESSPRRQRRIRALFDRAAGVIVLSRQWRDWVSGISSNPNIVTIPNAVSVPPELDSTHRRPHRLLFLGRMGRRKGLFDLLEALPPLVREYPDLQLEVGGDGPAAPVEAVVRRLGLEGHVRLSGWLTGDAKTCALLEATVFVLPSHNEGLPMALLEAMAHGLPVVATPVGGIPEAVEPGRTGILVPPGDVAALGQALRRYLGDPDGARAAGEAGRERVRADFSPEAAFAALRALYQQTEHDDGVVA